MAYYQLHLLNARHGLTMVLPAVRAAAAEAVAAASAHATVPDFDLVVRAEPGGGIPEWGVGGAAPAPGLIEVTLDPDRCTPEALVRTLVHEIHHLIRWDGPGYGRRLGEALVSEGLAGHFVTQVLGGPADPWDQAPVGAALARRAVAEWSRPGYDHAVWFHGRGDLRRWAGYGLGHQLIAALIADSPGQDSVTLAAVDADTLRPVLRRLVSRLDPEDEAHEDTAQGDTAQGDTPPEDAATEDAATEGTAPGGEEPDGAPPAGEAPGGESPPVAAPGGAPSAGSEPGAAAPGPDGSAASGAPQQTPAPPAGVS